MGRQFVVRFVNICTVPLVALLTMVACKPSSLLEKVDAPADSREQLDTPSLVGGARFTSGVWVDESDTVWSVSVEGEALRAVAECGPSVGLELVGEIEKNSLSYSVVRGDAPSIGEGRAMLVDGLHAYFIVNGETPSHGLFHFNHPDVAPDCSSKPPRRGPIDLRPSYENPRGD